MRTLVMALILAFCGSAAPAQPYKVHGPGALPCTTWSAYRTAGPMALYVPLETWVQGYVSAINGIGAINGHGAGYPIEDSDERWFRWLDDYCVSHPSDSLSTSTVALLHALQDEGATTR